MWRLEVLEIYPPPTSGAPSGLCSCRILLRTGVPLPLSIVDTELGAEGIRGDNFNNSNNNSNNSNSNSNNSNSSNDKSSASSRGRWLVLVTATGGELTLSLLRPVRGLDIQTPATGPEREGASSGSGTCRTPNAPKRLIRRCRTLVATWVDWAQLGYGPLQWMSHAQKALIARLSLYWLILKTPAVESGQHNLERHACRAKQAFDLPEEAFLCFRPVLSSVTRIVGTPSEAKASAVCRAGGAGGQGRGRGGRGGRRDPAANRGSAAGTDVREGGMARNWARGAAVAGLLLSSIPGP